MPRNLIIPLLLFAVFTALCGLFFALKQDKQQPALAYSVQQPAPQEQIDPRAYPYEAWKIKGCVAAQSILRNITQDACQYHVDLQTGASIFAWNCEGAGSLKSFGRFNDLERQLLSEYFKNCDKYLQTSNS